MIDEEDARAERDLPKPEPLKKMWLQMGAEIEGSWNRPRGTVAGEVRGAKAVVDKSVHIGIGDPGEIITRPHDRLDSLCDDVVALYPDHLHTTCGFHIHTSFTPMAGSILASREFYDFFLGAWVKWGKDEKLPRNHEFWARLEGRNVNCRDEFNPEVQLRGDGRGKGGKGGSARYTILNFMSWEVYRTIECRLLPMFTDRNMAVRAVRHLAWIYDFYLNTRGFQPITFETNSVIQGERALETYEVALPDQTARHMETEVKVPELQTGKDVFYALPDTPFDQMLPFREYLDVIKP